MSTPCSARHDRDRHHGDRRLPGSLDIGAGTRGRAAFGARPIYDAATIAEIVPVDVGNVELARSSSPKRGDAPARLEERHGIAAAAADGADAPGAIVVRTGTSPRGRARRCPGRRSPR
jgi:hypothetical protein